MRAAALAVALVFGSAGCQVGTKTCTDGTAFDDSLTECNRCLPSHMRVELDGGFRCDPRSDGGVPPPDDAGPCGTCSGMTPHCDEASAMCVACRDAGDCTAPAGMCVEHECVECVGNADCTDPAASLCEDGACIGCEADTDCTHLAATSVCDETSSRCVECTLDSEGESCRGTSCRLSDHTCTETPTGSRATCTSCEADSECEMGGRCARQTFMGRELGPFCFLTAGPGCGDTMPARRPYSSAVELTSIDGVAGELCMPPTTCLALDHTRDLVCTRDDECGEPDLADGLCPASGPGMGLCSYSCAGGVDCASPLDCVGAPLRCAP
jgi:hypothetical protein